MCACGSVSFVATSFMTKCIVFLFLACSCLNGVCDNRVLGSQGHCKLRSCSGKYIGDDCDHQIKICGTRVVLYQISSHIFQNSSLSICKSISGSRGQGPGSPSSIKISHKNEFIPVGCIPSAAVLQGVSA